MKHYVIAVLFVISIELLAKSATQEPKSCLPMKPLRHGMISCPQGLANGKRCRFVCDEGYVREKRTPKNKLCRCRERRGCFWVGKKQPACKPKTAPPSTLQQTSCDAPDYLKASYGLKEISPTGAIIKISVKPTPKASQGWSVVLILPRSLPKEFKISSGHVKLSGISNDRRTLTFNSVEHNQDISYLSQYDFHLNIKGVDDPGMYLGLVGFYDKLVPDGSCLENRTPVRPLPSSRPPTTRATTTSRPRRTTTRRPATRRTTTRRPATRRTTTRRPATRRTTTRRPATRRTTTRRPATRRTTTSLLSTTTALPSVTNNCEVLDDPGQPGYLLLNNGWREGNSWKFSSRVEKYPVNGEELNDWIFKVEFSNSVHAIQIFAAESEGGFADGRVWFIRPKSFNTNSRDPLRLNFLGTIEGGSAGPTAYVTFCRNGVIPDTRLSNVETSLSSAATTTTSLPTITETFTPTVPPPSPDLRNCDSKARQSYGDLPARSARTDPSNYNPSPYYSRRKPTPSGRTGYDYNKVLHYSILFYEAQRSGKLPANNRIPWRGNSGLKDGCDVGVDLTGGFYDAGDNVKFGFPMAYTMTVLAWGMIEFKDAYESSGDWQAALDLLKWGTDYFIKAHPSKYEFYAQVGDPARDHGEWLRPEDINYRQKSYKLDQNHPGSEVLAETAAALAAASIIFKSENMLSYANELISHARDLYEFANRFKGEYHLSIPGVETYYKSWNGYRDELLWGGVWLYQATNEDVYLDSVANNYDNYGAGNAPPEFSWDNKFAGVQVLMAQITGERKYIRNVEQFYAVAKGLPTTPNGLTWKSKWGSNRYAANFAFIFVMAAEVLDLQSGQERQFMQYGASQINYVLGQNELSKSYVVGLEQNSPTRPHHRASSCPVWRSKPVARCGFEALNRSGPNPHVLYGALVGGPNDSGLYEDDRKDFVSNEVATDYNAGFQSAVAGLQHLALAGRL